VILRVQLPSGKEVEAGEITMAGRAGREIPTFRYSQSYLADREAYALSPELRLGAGTFTPIGQRAMIGGIADAQPDSWGRRLIGTDRRRRGDEGRANELDVLVAVPDLTRQGAIRVHDGSKYQARAIGETPTLMDLPDLIEAARAFEDGNEVPDELRRLVVAGSSMGGARPKATVRMPDGRLAIAKLPRDDDFGDAMAWEATALRLAKQAGANVPDFDLQRIGDKSVLVIDRFDRHGDQRFGYLSADSLLVKQPGQDTDYTLLAETLAPVSASARIDLEELYRRVAVSLLVNNVDDHMKNHGLIRVRDGWTLSPLFDVNPLYRHGTASSTPVSPVDDPGDRDIRNLISSAGAYQLPSARAAEIVREVELATANWDDVATGFGITREALRPMSSAFENDNRKRATAISVPDRPAGWSVAPSTHPRNQQGRFARKPDPASGPNE